MNVVLQTLGILLFRNGVCHVIKITIVEVILTLNS